MSCHRSWLAAVLVALTTACLPKADFYLPPDLLPTAPGHVALYGSITAAGDRNVVSGTVYEPKEHWPSPAAGPLVAFAPARRAASPPPRSRPRAR